MTILEVLTGRVPFGRASDAGVVKRVIGGTRPDRPKTGFSNGLWDLLRLSWSEEYESQESKRPPIPLILEQLQKDSSAWFATARLPFPTVEPERSPFGSDQSSTITTEDADGGPELHDLLVGGSSRVAAA